MMNDQRAPSLAARPRLTPAEDRTSAPGVTVVTGAAAFIGRHLVEQLRSAGTELLPVEHAWESRTHLERLLGTFPVAACIHLGWYAEPGDYLSNEAANLLSLRSSVELLAALLSRGCEHLTAAGTSAEYRPGPHRLGESDELDDSTPYARAKSAVRELTAELSRASLLPTAWCRIFNVAGPGEYPDRLLPLVTRGLLVGSPVDLTDGSQLRDYLDVRDVAGALAAVSAAGVRGPVNICSGEGISLKELLSGLATRCGQSSELLKFGARPRRQSDPDVVVGDDTRLVEEVGWRPSIARGQMLDDVVGYWRSQLEQR
jgi:dTDP-6-deoxy-L-talose 4-dehydrogenase (NAD+)